MVPARDSAECTALRNSTMPMPPANESGPRIQKAIASPSGTSPVMSGPDATATDALIMALPTSGVSGKGLPAARACSRLAGGAKPSVRRVHPWCRPTSMARPVMGRPATLAALCGAPCCNGAWDSTR